MSKFADVLMTKWGLSHAGENPQSNNAAAKAALSKPAEEVYDAEYQQELETLRQERAEVHSHAP